MGCSESIHNDTCLVVEVWWQLIGGLRPNKPKILNPHAETPKIPFTLGLVHEVCVRYKIPGNDTDWKSQEPVCKHEVSPITRHLHLHLNVSDIIGNKTLSGIKCDEDANTMLSAVDPYTADLGLFVVSAFMMVLFGFKRRRGCQKPASCLQEPLTCA
eukprot:gnl/TRDRNA2_/TRDRNA2_195183_c0_seq1.p1 gnl/TRDRNA2_/TRDRNA2_195183_c0~~gnl/TRDRNA2_/TRDRNA2_195183_c0_seq1.p1  ORF type:complete len:157 (-),score=18.43 gnl/TRDRNA2_/TRDRNA2_195183_c0_seq1:66-536(-)